MSAPTLLRPDELRERALSADALRTLFREARTPNGFLDGAVSRETLEELVELSHLGPTSTNANPLRVVFVETPQGKARLLPALAPGNVEKAQQAPVIAILGHDLAFGRHMKRLFPHKDVSGMLADENVVREMARYNATLQTGYFILAARALGLDAGPMGGFNKQAVDREFFPDGTIKTDVLVNLGYGNDEKLFPRNPRLTVEEVARFE